MSDSDHHDLDFYLQPELDALRDASLFRELRTLDSPQAARVNVNGRELINFASNDYLGLASSQELRDAAKEAIDQYGVGAGSSRLISGTIRPHQQLETILAEWKGTEAALSFSTGFSAATGTIPNVIGRGDIVIIDKLVHACLVDAAKQSGATMRVFGHNDLDQLEKHLKWAAEKAAYLPSGGF